MRATYYDFNIYSERKYTEKLRYIHRNPVKRGLVASPELWQWSSFRYYLLGEDGPVRVGSYLGPTLSHKTRVQSHDILYKTSRDILYTLCASPSRSGGFIVLLIPLIGESSVRL